jgi:hypothetical protein
MAPDGGDFLLKLRSVPDGIGNGLGLQGGNPHLVPGAGAGEMGWFAFPVRGILQELPQLHEEGPPDPVQTAKGLG